MRLKNSNLSSDAPPGDGARASARFNVQFHGAHKITNRPAFRTLKRRERRAPSANHGFTLMELVVVVVIIGIMTAMIIPEMRGTFEDALLRSTGREIVNVFSLANSRAVSLNQSCRVRLDTKTGKYLLEKKIRDGGRENFVALKDVAGAEGKLDTRIAIEVRQPDDILPENNSGTGVAEADVSEAISFYPDGTADAAEILLRDRSGFKLRLQLSPVTSRVEIIESAHE